VFQSPPEEFVSRNHPGLVAIRLIAEAPEDEYFYVAWRLRHEAFLGFGYDPDMVFSGKADWRGLG